MGKARQTEPQDRVVEAREELPDVALQHESIATRETLRPVQRAMSALTDAIGVGVGNEAALEQRLDLEAQCVVHDAVPERGSGNDPPLGLVDPEAGVARWSVATGQQLVAKGSELVPKPMLERRDRGTAPLALGGPTVGVEQVLPRTEKVVHRESLKRAPVPGRSQGTGKRLFARPALHRTRPGTGSAVLRLGPQGPRPTGGSGEVEEREDTSRKPLLSLRLSGLFLLRLAARRLFSLLLNDPPRNTRRFEPAPTAGQPVGPPAVKFPAVTLCHPPSNRPISAIIVDT